MNDKALTLINFVAPWDKWTSSTLLEASNLPLFGQKPSWGWHDLYSSNPYIPIYSYENFWFIAPLCTLSSIPRLSKWTLKSEDWFPPIIVEFLQCPIPSKHHKSVYKRTILKATHSSLLPNTVCSIRYWSSKVGLS